LAAHGKLALYLKSEPFHGPQNVCCRATGYTPLLYAICRQWRSWRGCRGGEPPLAGKQM